MCDIASCDRSTESSSLDPSETSVELSGVHRSTFRQRNRIIAHLRGPDGDSITKRRADRIAACCCAPVIRRIQGGGIYIAPGRCQDRLCGTCQRARSRRLAGRIAELTRGWNSMRLMTLTLKPREDLTLGEQLDRLTSSFRKMRQTAAWKKHVTAGIACIEVTPGKANSSGHVHLHAVFTGEFFPHELLKRAWLAATGDSYIVDLRPCPDRASAATYVAAYVSKTSDLSKWPDAKLWSYIDAMKSRRLVITFGSKELTTVDRAAEDEKLQRGATLCSVREIRSLADAGEPHALAALVLMRSLGGLWAAVTRQPPLPFNSTHSREQMLAELEDELLACHDVLTLHRPPPEPERSDDRQTAAPPPVDLHTPSLFSDSTQA